MFAASLCFTWLWIKYFLMFCTAWWNGTSVFPHVTLSFVCAVSCLILWKILALVEASCSTQHPVLRRMRDCFRRDDSAVWCWHLQSDLAVGVQNIRPCLQRVTHLRFGVSYLINTQSFIPVGNGSRWLDRRPKEVTRLVRKAVIRKAGTAISGPETHI